MTDASTEHDLHSSSRPCRARRGYRSPFCVQRVALSTCVSDPRIAVFIDAPISWPIAQ